MDATKHDASPYSREAVATTPLDSLPQPPNPAAFPGMQPGASLPKETLQTRLSAFVESVRNLRHLSLAELVAFLKRTRRLWLTATGAVFGMIALVTVVESLVEWSRNARERRHELAVATVTPDRLIARCGEAAQDVTKQVEPILMRTMSYHARGDQSLVLAFSRTAEENSDWVFLSMSDERTSASFDSPDAKIAALPCLDSAK